MTEKERIEALRGGGLVLGRQGKRGTTKGTTARDPGRTRSRRTTTAGGGGRRRR